MARAKAIEAGEEHKKYCLDAIPTSVSFWTRMGFAFDAKEESASSQLMRRFTSDKLMSIDVLTDRCKPHVQIEQR